MLSLLLLSLLGTSDAAHCVFLHGIGQTHSRPATKEDDQGYWGKTRIHEYLGDGCTSTSFIHQDTSTRGWDDADLQKAYCDLVVGSSSGIAKDTIIVTHSLGNLIFAGALHNGFCSLGAGTRWLSLSAPWHGSKAAAWLTSLCSQSSILSEPLRWLANELKFCNGTKPTTAYDSLAPSNPFLANGTLAGIAEKHVSGALCGTSAIGMGSKFSIPLEALSAAVRYGEKNDGMVPVSSCELPSKTYVADPSKPFYVGHLNHADGTLRDGERKKANERPGTWLKAMTSSSPSTSEYVTV